MAYARWGPESDVFVIEHVDGHFECICCCRLREDFAGHTTETRSEMIEHLRRHRQLGDKVPDVAFHRIEKDIAEFGETTEPVDVDAMAAEARAEKAKRKPN